MRHGLDGGDAARGVVHRLLQFGDLLALARLGGLDALGEALEIVFDRLVGRLELADDVGEAALDARQTAIDRGIGAARVEARNIVFEPRDRACRLRIAAQRRGILVLAAFDALKGMAQGVAARLRGALDGTQSLVDRRNLSHALIDQRDLLVDLRNLRYAGFDLREMLIGRAVVRFRFRARLRHAAGQRLEIGGECRDLRGGLVCCGRDLVGKARKTLMQALDRIARAVVRRGMLDALQAVGKAHHAAAELVEGLGLFARGDVDLRRRLAHGAVVFGLVALGGLEAARDIAQLLLDAAVDVVALVLAARHMREHVFGVAADSSGFGLGGITAAIGGPLFASRGHVIRRVGKAAENAPGHPFAD